MSFREPGKFQLAIEMMVSGLLGLSTSMLGEKKGRQIFSFIFTFFIFIFISNWFGLLPFVPTTVIGKTSVDEGSISNQASLVPVVKAQDTSSKDVVSINTDTPKQDTSLGSCLSTKDCILTLNGVQRLTDEKHVFRAPTSDLSLTLALALISVLITNILGFVSLKGAYLKKYINFSNPIDAFVGILEIISEVGKLISFSFRLFGNIFAGEILLAVITSISYGLLTLPFLGLELFVGLIQALVFFMLTAVLIGLSTTPHSGGHHEEGSDLEELPLTP